MSISGLFIYGGYRATAMTGDLFSSESVTRGHPDKLCDTVSDAIVDACLAIDSNARVAVETCVKGKEDKGLIVLAGEVSLNGNVPDYEKVARDAAAAVGYTSHAIGMDATTSDYTEVQVHITTQSAYIAQGVNQDQLSQGAGDQGLMFGYACTETESFEELKGRYFPLAAALSQRLTRRLTAVREQGILPWARPDGKSQVTVEYDGDKPIRIDTIVVSTQHAPHVSNEEIQTYIIEKIIKPELPGDLDTSDITYHINPTGRFVVGGPHGDAGLTGRKIIIDTYGGRGAHGGGAFSGKDPSKVDRSAAYAARHISKNLVKAGVSDEILIQLGYAIGVAEPVSINVDTCGKSKIKISDSKLSEIVNEIFDLKPHSIESRFKLRDPIYIETASYGHMGRKSEKKTKTFNSKYSGVKKIEVELFPWEKLEYVNQLIKTLKL